LITIQPGNNAKPGCDPSAPSSLQHSLAARHRTGPARVDLGGQAQRPGEGLEAGLHDVVGIHPIQLADVQREAGVVHHRHKELFDQFGVVRADLLGRDLQTKAQVRPAAAIERHLHQGLIERRHEVAEAVDAAAVAQRLRQGLADGDAHIFIGVVIVDVGVAHRVHLQINQPMAADLVKHVIEKRHAGVRLAATGAIKVELHAHIGFTGDAVDLAATHVGHRRRSAGSKISIMPGRNTPRRPRVQVNLSARSMSKAQLMAFLAKAETNPAIQQRIDAAADVSAVVAIAREEGFLFSAASLSRHQRG